MLKFCAEMLAKVSITSPASMAHGGAGVRGGLRLQAGRGPQRKCLNVVGVGVRGEDHLALRQREIHRPDEVDDFVQRLGLTDVEQREFGAAVDEVDVHAEGFPGRDIQLDDVRARGTSANAWVSIRGRGYRGRWASFYTIRRGSGRRFRCDPTPKAGRIVKFARELHAVYTNLASADGIRYPTNPGVGSRRRVSLMFSDIISSRIQTVADGRGVGEVRTPRPSGSRSPSSRVDFWYGSKQALFNINLAMPETLGRGVHRAERLREVDAAPAHQSNERSRRRRPAMTGEITLDGNEHPRGDSVNTVDLRQRVGMVFQKVEPVPEIDLRERRLRARASPAERKRPGSITSSSGA